MKIILGRLLFLLVGVTFSHYGIAQDQASAGELNLEGNLAQWYENEIGIEHTPLYVGSAGISEIKALVSHPYYHSSVWTTESIWYRGHQFNQVKLLYDINEDMVLVKNEVNPQAIHPLKPIQNQVTRFTINGDLFKYIPNRVGLYNPGFFQVIYESENAMVIVKRIKVIKIGGVSGESSYAHDDRTFMKRTGDFVLINRRSDFLNLYPDQKKTIRRYIRKNGLKPFRKGNEDQLKTLMGFCEDLPGL